MELRDLLAVVWKRKLTVAIVTVAAVAAAALYAQHKPARYSATATLALTPNVAQGQGFVASDDLSTLLSTYAQTAQSAQLRSAAAQLLGRPLNATASASSTTGTGILQITATSPVPADAQRASAALARAFQNDIPTHGLLNVQLIDHPQLPTSAVQPRPPLIIGGGLILGLAIGIALCLIQDRWFDQIETVDDVARTSRTATLTQIPRSRQLRGGGAHSLAWDKPNLVTVHEAFRKLRTNLQFSIDSDEFVVVVTSGQPGEGKSTVAANLAVAIASVGVETILVDADFYAPQQQSIFGVPNVQGLSNLLARPDTYVDELLEKTRYPGLSVLPSGSAPPSPTEVLATRMEPALAALRGAASAIVIDSPPVLAVSDPRLIAPLADSVLVVAASRRTKSASLREALALLHLANARISGVVLNRVAAVGGRYGGYYNRYSRARALVHDAPIITD